MSTPAERFDAIVAEYVRLPDVTLGRSLDNDVLSVQGRIFAFLRDGRLVVKLPAAEAATLVLAGDAEPFPAGQRPKKQWVSVGDPAAWADLVARAKAYAQQQAV